MIIFENDTISENQRYYYSLKRVSIQVFGTMEQKGVHTRNLSGMFVRICLRSGDLLHVGRRVLLRVKRY